MVPRLDHRRQNFLTFFHAAPVIHDQRRGFLITAAWFSASGNPWVSGCALKEEKS